MPTSSGESCRAAVLVKPGDALEIRNVRIPNELEPGAILVRTSLATVCASDVHLWEGAVGLTGPAAPQLPAILGHEQTGTVARLGGGVVADSVGQPLQVGDRIVWTHGFCGQCLSRVIHREPTLCDNRRTYMFARCDDYPYLTGGFSEYCYVYPTSGRIRVPDEIPDTLASAASCALRTVVHAFDRLGSLDERHSVVIQGSGPLGLFAVAKAVASGAAVVVVVGGPESRLSLASAWGATGVIDVTTVEDPSTRHEAVMEYTKGRGADVVIEASGALDAFGEGMRILRAGGRYLVVGQVHGQAVPFTPGSIVRKQATIIGSLSASVEHYWRALEFLRRHRERFEWEAMITNYYPLTRINEALEGMRSWTEIKPAIVFE